MFLKDIIALSNSFRGKVDKIYIDEDDLKYKGQKNGRIYRVYGNNNLTLEDYVTSVSTTLEEKQIEYTNYFLLGGM